MTGNARRVLGVEFCPVCRQDTLPLDATGCCAWCDTQLVEPLAGIVPDPSVGFCEHCGEMFEDGAMAVGPSKRFCSRAHQKQHWLHNTDAGRRWKIEKGRRRRARIRERRAAA